jgi:hypothetical protein
VRRGRGRGRRLALAGVDGQGVGPLDVLGHVSGWQVQGPAASGHDGDPVGCQLVDGAAGAVAGPQRPLVGPQHDPVALGKRQGPVLGMTRVEVAMFEDAGADGEPGPFGLVPGAGQHQHVLPGHDLSCDAVRHGGDDLVVTGPADDPAVALPVVEGVGGAAGAEEGDGFSFGRVLLAAGVGEPDRAASPQGSRERPPTRGETDRLHPAVVPRHPLQEPDQTAAFRWSDCWSDPWSPPRRPDQRLTAGRQGDHPRGQGCRRPRPGRSALVLGSPAKSELRRPRAPPGRGPFSTLTGRAGDVAFLHGEAHRDRRAHR